MAGDMPLECVESTRELGVRTLYMPPVDFTALVERAPQIMQPDWPGPTVSTARSVVRPYDRDGHDAHPWVCRLHTSGGVYR